MNSKLMLVTASFLLMGFSGCIGGESRGIVDGLTEAGGAIINTLPTWTSFTGTGSADNSGTSTEVFTGVVNDVNGESDLVSFTLTITPLAGVPVIKTHTINATNLGQLTEPGSFDAQGWKVWTGTMGDGTLNFKFQYTYPLGTNLGLAAITSSTTDGIVPVLGPVLGTVISVFSSITVGALPVDTSGATTAASWGLWAVEAGANNTSSSNFLVLTNVGQKSDAQVVVDFGAAFVGVSDANSSISVDNNIQFRWGRSGLAQTPTQVLGNFTAWGSTSASGTVTVTFNGLAQIIYVQYRIVDVPAIIKDQTYTAAFTVSEV